MSAEAILVLPGRSRVSDAADTGALEQRAGHNQSTAEASGGITGRAITVGLIMVVAFTVIGCFGVFLRYELIGTGYLPRGAIFILLALIGANAAMRLAGRLTGRWRLTSRELLVVFLMLMVVGAIAGQEFTQHFYLYLLGVVYYATPDIAPPELYLDSLNPLLLPGTSPQDGPIRWAWEGLPAGMGVPWRAWLMPLAVWTPFFFAVYWLVICFMAVLAYRWEREERLLYPLVEVPMETASDEPSSASQLMRNPLMWWAFAFACVLYSIKGIHAYWPVLPDIDLQRETQTVLGGPWSAFNRIPTHFYPEMVGVTYLLTSEVGFSLWFFYRFQKVEQFARIAVGIDVGRYQFCECQAMGGYLVLAAALLWSARGHLKRAVAVAVGAFKRDPDAPDAGEPYRLAVIGAIGSIAFIVWWGSWAGLNAAWGLVQYLLFPLVSLVVARVVAEAGMFIYSSPFRLNEAIFQVAGTERIGQQNVTLMTMMSWTQIRSTATMNMAAVAQALKIGSETRADRAKVMGVAMAAIAVAILASHAASLYIIYSWGVPKLGWWPSGASLGTTTRLVRYLEVPTAMQPGDWGAMTLGGAMTWALVSLRRYYVWWPLHPLGFITWMGWPIHRYWMSIFIGWLWKATVVRLGGYRAYNHLRPIAFGLILGVSVILTIWIVIHYFAPAPSIVRE